MAVFSIEMAAEQIYHTQTRDYFKEVLGSYINGYYRSAVVMLWSVVICDLVYKLQDMRDIYNDAKAKEILEEIQEIQRKNPNSSEWEKKLLDLVKNKTSLLEKTEYLELEHLQSHRHLSAHPVLDQTELLHTPNKETTRALIRNALEAVLLKPPILTREIIETFVEDIAAKKEILLDDETLKRYIEAKYLKNLKPAVENSLFFTLWKFAFQLSNEDTDPNRDINIRILHILYRRRPTEINTYIKDNIDRFSKGIDELVEVERDDRFEELICFLEKHPLIYPYLNDPARMFIEQKCNEDIEFLVYANFIFNDDKEHIDTCISLIDKTYYYSDMPTSRACSKLITIALESNYYSKLIDLAIQMYTGGNGFERTLNAFKDLLQLLIPYITQTQASTLLNGIEKRSYTYNDYGSALRFTPIKDRCDELFGPDYDYSQFPNFIQGLEKGSQWG